MKLKLKKDVVIKAGTVFDNVDSLTIFNGKCTYEAMFELTDNTFGCVTYFLDDSIPHETDDWFEEVN